MPYSSLSMRKITTLLLLIFCLSSGFAQNNPWLTSLEDAQKLSIATNKLIFIDFYANWCGPCKKMEREAFSDPEIKKVLNNFVLVRLDFDREVNLRNRYGVRAIPFLFVVDSHGNVINKERGYSGKNSVQDLLEANSVNTSFFQRENVQYFQNQNYATGLRLAQKYLDFSLFLSKEIRSDFLNVAEAYIDNSEDLLDKNQSNYQMISQKIELMQLTSDLYNEQYRKLERGLGKIEENEVEELNRDLYNFLNYCLAYQKGEEELTEKWEAEILASSASNDYMKRKDELFGLVN